MEQLNNKRKWILNKVKSLAIPENNIETANNFIEYLENLEIIIEKGKQNKLNKNIDSKVSRKCRYYDRGFCKYGDSCENHHSENMCSNFLKDGKCMTNACLMRHPKNCHYWMKNEDGCRFEKNCQYLHKIEKKFKRFTNEVSHSKVQRFSCTECNFITNKKSEFDIHDEKMHKECTKCDQCDYQATNKEKNMINHVQLNHQRKQTEGYDCKQCNYKSTHKLDLMTHVKDLHEKLVSCDKCKINKQEITCIDCTKDCCLPCIQQLNQKGIDKALAMGIIDKEHKKELEENKFICKTCFRRRCIDKGLKLQN